MKIKWKPLILCLAIPVAVGALSALITNGSMEVFAAIDKPPLSPPGWLFPIVWTALFLLMGYASYLVVVSGAPDKVIRMALTVYGIQLALNFCWTILFFNAKLYLFSFLWLVVLWLVIWANIVLFGRIRRVAGWYLVPYIAWVTFAGYLNYGIFLLN